MIDTVQKIMFAVLIIAIVFGILIVSMIVDARGVCDPMKLPSEGLLVSDANGNEFVIKHHVWKTYRVNRPPMKAMEAK